MPSKTSSRARKGAVAAVVAATSLLAGLVGQAGAQAGLNIGVSNTPIPSWGTARAVGAECPRNISGSEVCPFSGRIWETLVKDDVVYISGEFSSVAPTIAMGGALDGTSGLPRPGFAQINDGEVKVAIPDGEGGWYIGGSFTGVNEQDARGVAHIRPDGSLDTGFTVSFPSIQQGSFTVHALALRDTFLYIGGEFTRFVNYGTDGNKAHLARVSKASGTLETSFTPAPDGVVRSIAVSGDGTRVYFAGDFNSVKSAPTPNGVAAVDNFGNPQAWQPAMGARANAVTVSPDGARIYVGSNAVTAVDPAGTVVWNVAADKPVKSLAVSRSGSSVFAGGDFGSVGGEPHPRIAAVDAASGVVNTSWNPDAGGPVTTLSVSEDDTTLYVGGNFAKVRGSERHNLAAVDVATGALTPWDPNATGPVSTVAASGSLVYAGGNFDNLGAQPRSRLAALDIQNGNLLGWSPKIENLNADGTQHSTLPVVQSMAFSADRNAIYIGGIFNQITGPDGRRITRENLALVDLAGNVVESFNPGAPQGAVRSLALHENTLYAGGDFQRIRVSGTAQGGGRADNPCPAGNADCTPIGGKGGSSEWKRAGLIAAFEATTGVLDLGFNKTPASTGPGLIGQSGKVCSSGSSCGNGAIKSISIAPDSQFLYIAGTFSDLGGQLGIASLNRSNGSFTTWQPDTNIPIFDAAVAANGDIFTAGGGGGGKIHRYRQGGACNPGSRRTWPEDPCKPVWEQVYDGDSTSVDVSNGFVYGGGHFDFVTSLGAERHHAAAFSQDGVIVDNWYPRLDTSEGVFSMRVVPGRMVVVAGNFNRVNPCSSGNPQEKPCWRAQPGIALFPGDTG